MSLVDFFFSVGSLKRAFWQRWYPFLTRKLRADDILFLNYAFETEPPLNVPLESADEPNRACIQLYHHVATQVELRDKDILEVSCGHGGGASYLTRTFHPRQYTGLDLNAAGIAFCQERHRVDRLRFIEGDAEKLPFADATFDAVINIEASHCYPSLSQFLGEVARVLKPGGTFLYADFRLNEDIPRWEAALKSAPLILRRMRVINEDVVRGMNKNSSRSLELIGRHLPTWFHPLGRQFAGVKDSRLYRAAQRNELSYRSYFFEKPLESRSG